VIAVDLGLWPSSQSAVGAGTFQVQLANLGNTQLVLDLEGADPEGKCDYQFASGRVRLEAGESEQVLLTVTPVAGTPSGEPIACDFIVKATPLGAPHRAKMGEGRLVSEQPRPRRRGTALRVLMGIVGLLVVGLVLVLLATQFLPRFSQGGDGGGVCSTVEECHAQAQEFMEAQDWRGAIARLDRAIALVPGGERPPFAHLWCEKAEVYLRMERPDEAVGNFERCIEWTQGVPELGELRGHAEEAIGELRRR
jgi:hypothetical protein